MGESVVPNFDPRLGSTKWADWTNQASNRPLIVAQFRELIPVQEMLPFQRQIFQENAEGLPSQNQTTVFNWVVPQDEAWRILSVAILHTDTAALTFAFTIISARDVNILMPVSRETLNANIAASLYPAANSSNTANDFRQQPRPPREAFPGDTVQVRMLTGITAPGGAQVNVFMRAELIPLPLSDQLIELATVVSS